MKTPLSPSDIEFILHCYYSPVPHPRLHAPAIQESLAMFLESKMIVRTPNGDYNTTAKGDAFIKLLCKTPEPLPAWVDPRGEFLNLG